VSILGIIASSRLAAVGDFQSIATVTVDSGGAADVEFTSISGTYTHLQIRSTARADNADTNNAFKIQFNSDTGNNYARHELYANGATVRFRSRSLYWIRIC
jgi:hypothetical protein